MAILQIGFYFDINKKNVLFPCVGHYSYNIKYFLYIKYNTG